MKITIYILFGLYVAAALTVNFLAYFVTSENGGVIYDGLGRQLTIAPTLLRLIFGADRLYPGFFWFVFDTLLFFGIFGLGLLVGRIAEKD